MCHLSINDNNQLVTAKNINGLPVHYCTGFALCKLIMSSYSYYFSNHLVNPTILKMMTVMTKKETQGAESKSQHTILTTYIKELWETAVS